MLSINPGDPLAFVPLSSLGLARGRCVYTNAVLLSVFPVAIVAPSVGPEEDSLALLLIVDVLTLVPSTIGPGEDPAALHLVVLPLALVDSAVRPLVDAYK